MKIVKLSSNKIAVELFEKIVDEIFDKDEKKSTINMPEKGGVTAYYFNMNLSEVEYVDAFLANEKISPLNTRLIKFEKNGTTCYGYLVASIENKIVNHNNNIYGFYGEFDSFLIELNKELSQALKYTKREFQISMLEKYIESFKTGSIEAHKQSQIEWIKDIKPVVETNIGWIETYVDPTNIRAYYEGFVALVDKENSKKFSTLVDNAGELLSPNNIPWNKDFEIYPFKEPDYTQIDMIAFASDGCPMGINIPNYDDIRERYGYKNVTIGNNQPSFKVDKIKFMPEEDKPLLEKWGNIATTIHTACHELLGHGSGKLCRDEGGVKNFNPETLDLNGNKATYYKENETFESIFKSICRSYEECRADVSGIFFGKFEKVGAIFGVDPKDMEDVIYTKWIIHIRKGLLGSKFYNPTNNKWGQAHVQGAYVFFKYIMNNQKKDDPIIELEVKEDDFIIKVNKKNISAYGHKLASDLLTKLNVWKSTANITEAGKFYDDHSEVDETVMKIREIVIEKTSKRALTINNNLFEKDGKIEVKEYEENSLGLIQSYIERYPDSVSDEIIKQYSRWNNLQDLI